MTWTPQPPIEVILAWPPKSAHPEIIGPAQYIVTRIFGSIAAVAVLFRLYTRAFTRRYFGIDDYLIIVAFLCAIGLEVCITLGKARYAWDRHLWDWDVSLAKGSLIVLYLARILWGLSTACVRLSILCLYYRLLKRLGACRHHFWILHVVTGFTILFLFQMILGGVIPCIPVRAYWDYQDMNLKTQKFKCINDYRAMQFSSVFNTVSEIVIAILPVAAVFRFNVDPNQRWGVIGLFSLGYLVAIAGVVRSYYLWKVVETYDLTWWASPQWCCSEVELDLALTCACAAPLRPPIARFIRRVKGLPESFTRMGRRTPFGKDDRSILSTTALSGQQEVDKFVGVAVVEEDDRNAWVQQMSRTIDLEGIAVDGFGYTVSIQGPESAAPRSRMSRHIKGTLRALSSAVPARRSTVKDKECSGRKEAPIELAEPSQPKISRSVEVSADETSRVNSEDYPAHNSRISSKQGSRRVSEQGSNPLTNYTSLDTP